MADVEITRPHGPMAAHLAVPGDDGPWPGVVVVHDALGMTTDLRNQADWLAGEGYLALAPDLYYWGSRMRCLFATMRAAVAGEGQAFDDLEAARAWLADREDCTGRIGVIGFCMGGGYALLLAVDRGFSASSVNYGTVPGNAFDLLADACPVVGSYGGRDLSLRGAPEKLDDILTRHGVPHDVKTYPEAGHGFMNDHAPGETPLWAVVAGSFARTAHHEPSAVDARRRIAEFFEAHLR